MKELTLVIDERELSAIQAALLLLQEQIDVLPEDLAEMLREHGPPISETELDRLNRRLSADDGTTSYAAKDVASDAHYLQRS
jgi:hypothetical protein